ncbi:hypothetical protein BBEV_2334 [Salisediminibacterium beveridgei]|uniref:Uncharacterized protein n=2 Tax=Salisediminibacterium beveridgei TaxID=632773 RepID=A0A1D7QXE7_9BACI|nr:hypothetical protein BBEV_2334 [Salisediminibacterium beveridgei]
MQGYEWWPVHGFVHQDRVYWIHEQAFLIKQTGEDWQAWALICPDCRSSLHYQSFSDEIKCFTCNFQWTADEARNHLDLRPVKFIRQQLHILYKKKR